MGKLLVRAGLILLAVSLGLGLAAKGNWIPEDTTRAFIYNMALGGVALTVIGVVLSLLGVGAGLFGRARCARCRKPVRKGAIYCADHMKEAMMEARDKYHREHGSGI